MDVQTQWGATVYMGRLESGSIQYIPFSLYSPITPDSEWQFSTTFVPDWKDVSATVTNWNSYFSGNWTESVTGTQYFRKEVRALTNMAAYDLRVFYTSGVVAYVNGVEVFRDNMPEGVPTAETLATGSFSTADYHGIIRSGMDLLKPNAVIAIELHFQNTESRPVTFKAALSQLSSVSTTSNCHRMGGYNIMSTEASAPNLIDFNEETMYSVSANEGTVFYNWDNMRVMVNAWMVGVGAVDVAPTSFVWEGGMSSTEAMTAMGTVEMSGYEANKKYLTNYVNVDGLYSSIKMVMSGSASSVSLKSLFPMVCSAMPPTSIGYESDSYSFMTAVDAVNIESGVKGFVNCTTSPALPEGLSIDSECRISGSSMVSGSGEYTVSGWTMEKTVSSVITLTFTQCNGAAIRIERVGTAPGEVATIRSGVSDPIRIEENGVQKRCMPAGQYTVTMSGGLKWSENSSLRIYSLVGLGDAVMIADLHFDSAAGASSTVPLSLTYPIPVASEWKYHAWMEGWKTTDGSNWSSGKVGTFPLSESVQVYKKSIVLESVRNMELVIRYQHGCVVLVNGNEVFRDGVNGEVTGASIPSHSYESLMERSITLPSTVFSLGTNVMTVVLVNPSSAISTFNGVMRQVGDYESRVLSHTVSLTGLTPANAKITSIRSGVIVSGENTNNVLIELNDHFESISRVVLHFQPENYAYPSSVKVEGRKNDGSWETLIDVKYMKPESGMNKVEILVPSPIPRSAYRLTNLSAVSSWFVTGVDLQLATISAPTAALSYADTDITETRDINILPASAVGYTDFTFSEEQAGLTINTLTGRITGTMLSNEEKRVRVNAKRADNGESVTTTFMIITSNCESGKTLIAIAVTSNIASSVTVSSDAGTVKEFTIDYAGDLETRHICLLSGFYTLQVTSTQAPSASSSYYAITMAEGQLDLARGPITSKDFSVVFSSLSPIGTSWRVSETEMSGWKEELFDDMAWNAVDALSLSKTKTSYLRHHMNLGDISKYPVMNLRMQYNGGVVVYLNGNKVGRFNIANPVTSTSSPISSETVTSNFHIILPLSGGRSGDNVLAIEFHPSASVESSVLSVMGGMSMGEFAVVADSWDESGNVAANLEGSVFNAVMMVPMNSIEGFSYSLSATKDSMSGVIGSYEAETLSKPVTVDVSALVYGMSLNTSVSSGLVMKLNGYKKNGIVSSIWYDENNTPVISGLSMLNANTAYTLHMDSELAHLFENAMLEVRVDCGDCVASIKVNDQIIQSFDAASVKRVVVSSASDYFLNGLDRVSVMISSMSESAAFSGIVRYVPSHTSMMQGVMTMVPPSAGPVRYLYDGLLDTVVFVRNQCVDVTLTWNFENSVLIPVNEYFVSNGDNCNIYTPSGWKLYGQNGDNWVLLDEESSVMFSEYMQTKSFLFNNTIGYHTMKIVVTECNNPQLAIKENNCNDNGFQLSELMFSVFAEKFCPAMDDYPSTPFGNTATKPCPAGYSGTKSRTCNNGVFGPEVNNCSLLPPTITLDVTEFTGTMGEEMIPITPTIEGLEVSVSVLPTLPAGLSLNPQTGVVSGIPTAVTAQASYTLTATNSAGSNSATFSLVVVEGPANCEADGEWPAVDNGEYSTIGCPEFYSGEKKRLCTDGVLGAVEDMCTLNIPTISIAQTEYVFMRDEEIEPIVPTIVGAEYTVTINPALPADMVMDSQTGVISGTPRSAIHETMFTITVTNAAGPSFSVIAITIDFIGQSCPSVGEWPETEHDHDAMLNICGEYYEGYVSRHCYDGVFGPEDRHCTLLPPMISLNMTEYNYIVGEEIEPIVPVIAGAEIIGVTVSPSLPTGLVMDAMTGVISGVPSEVSEGNYTLIVTNAAGSDSVIFDMMIEPMSMDCAADGEWPAAKDGEYSEVTCPQYYDGKKLRLCAQGILGPVEDNCVLIAPTATLEQVEYEFTRGKMITPITPVIVGALYTIAVEPVLPAGLEMDMETGAITGVPEVVQEAVEYTMTVSNESGMATLTFMITVLSGSTDCDALYGYPASRDGETVTKPCPEYYDGMLSRTCVNGLLSEETGECLLLAPVVELNVTEYIFYMNEEIEPITPTIMAAEYNVELIGSVPSGIEVDRDTGVISGIPTEEVEDAEVSLVVSNLAGVDSVNITITVTHRPENCLADGEWPAAEHGQYSVVSCPAFYDGEKKRYCDDGILGVVVDTCTLARPSILIPQAVYSFMQNKPITPIVPVISAAEYILEITPDLPEGLSMNNVTGVISGTPLVVMSATTYEITVINEQGEASAEFSLTIVVESRDCEATDRLPFTVDGEKAAANCVGGKSGYEVFRCTFGEFVLIESESACVDPTYMFHYPVTSVTLAVGEEMSPLRPVTDLPSFTATITPALPQGLTMGADGVISGRAMASSEMTTYTVVAESLSAEISIAVNMVYCEAMDSFPRTVSGESASVNTCPEGTQGSVTRDCVDGEWSSATTNCVAIPPSALMYSSGPISVKVGEAIPTLMPMLTGTASSFSISPALPSGLTLSTSQGVLYGVPTAVSAMKTYTITATNGSTTSQFTLSITVTAADCGSVANGSESVEACPAGYSGRIVRMCTNGVLGDAVNECSPVAPTELAFTIRSPLLVNEEVMSVPASVSGVNVTFSVSPALPEGLSLNSASGVISGKVLSEVSVQEYTMIASNQAGSVEVKFELGVVKGSCAATADLKVTAIGEEVTMACPVKGQSVYKCEVSEDGVNGKWSEPDVYCETRSVKTENVIGWILLVVGVIILIVAVILFMNAGKKTLPKKDTPTIPKPVEKATESKAEEPKKVEEPKAEEPKKEEPKAEEPKAEEPKKEEPKAEEPKEPAQPEAKAEEPKPEATPAESTTSKPDTVDQPADANAGEKTASN